MTMSAGLFLVDEAPSLSVVRNRTYHVGCTGERSVPVTVALGYRSAISMAHKPVPVPISRIRRGLSRGER